MSGPLKRVIDHRFGFDFFISYSHADGEVYPQNLAKALVARRFSVFLDEEVYTVGDELFAASTRLHSVGGSVPWEPERRIAISQNGDHLASGGFDGQIVVWSTATGQREWALPNAHSGGVAALALKTGSSELISVGNDGSVAGWPTRPDWWVQRAGELAPTPPCPS